MKDIIIIVVLVIILGAAIYYIYKSKKNGKKCIGCPDGRHCQNKSGCSNCSDKK